LAAFLNSIFQPSDFVIDNLKFINRVCLLTGLFCIGTQINKQSLYQLKFKPIALAALVWAAIIPTSLILVIRF